MDGTRGMRTDQCLVGNTVQSFLTRCSTATNVGFHTGLVSITCVTAM